MIFYISLNYKFSISIQFRFIPCPNCQVRHDGPTLGWSNPGLYAAVMPTCLVCNGNSKLVICYNCNKTTRYKTLTSMEKQ